MSESEEEKEYSQCFNSILYHLSEFLSRKVIQAIEYASSLAAIKKEDRKEFLKDLSMEQFVFVLFLHGLMNKDLALCGLTARVLAAKKNTLILYSPELEIWARRTFNFSSIFVLRALHYSSRIRKSHIFMVPRGIYRILSGATDRVILRPIVRESLKSQPQFRQVRPPGEDIGSSSSNIHHSSSLLNIEMERNKEKKVYQEATPHYNSMLSEYMRYLSPLVTNAIQLTKETSIYNEKFTLENLDSPARQFFLLFISALFHREPILLGLTLHWLSLHNIHSLGVDFKTFIATGFTFGGHHLVRALRYIRKLKRTCLFYFPPEIYFIITSLAERNGINVEEVIVRNIKKKMRNNVGAPKRKRYESCSSQSSSGSSKSSELHTLERTRLLTKFLEETGRIEKIENSPDSTPPKGENSPVLSPPPKGENSQSTKMPSTTMLPTVVQYPKKQCFSLERPDCIGFGQIEENVMSSSSAKASAFWWSRSSVDKSSPFSENVQGAQLYSSESASDSDEMCDPPPPKTAFWKRTSEKKTILDVPPPPPPPIISDFKFEKHTPRQ